ncbi:MAG TPA: radical SAM protein [Fervidobacterium sp.]|nr:radical SAM protein [Fervidobacterium sp.]HRD19530.1 radical SAM protein [Fervidobacterium sp.]
MSTKDRRKIYPFFLPNAGCRTRCSFCNQLIMTGETIPDFSKLENMDFSNIDEIAFYGGTFTGLKRETIERLLCIAPHIPKRISTKPDLIDDSTVQMLKDGNVKVLEIGIESLDDEVLEYSKRGYKAEDAIKSIERLKKDFEIIAHLMVGLPHDSKEKDLESIRLLLDNGIRAFRIHPTLVFKDTELEKLHKDGLYTPLSLEEALDVVVDMTILIESANGHVTRLGYHVPQSQMKYLIAGPYHSSFGDIVRSVLIRKIIEGLSIKKVTYSYRYKPWFYAHGNGEIHVEREEVGNDIDDDILFFDDFTYAQSLNLLIERSK